MRCTRSVCVAFAVGDMRMVGRGLYGRLMGYCVAEREGKISGVMGDARARCWRQQREGKLGGFCAGFDVDIKFGCGLCVGIYCVLMCNESRNVFVGVY